MERPMSQAFDASRSLTALDQDSTIIAVIEISQSSWLAAALVPGVKRQPLKKLETDQDALLKLLAGATKPAEPGTRSRASPSPTRPDATASGWRAGCGGMMSRPT